MLDRVTETQVSHISAAILCKLSNLHNKSVSGKNCKYLLCCNPCTSNSNSPELAYMKKLYYISEIKNIYLVLKFKFMGSVY